MATTIKLTKADLNAVPLPLPGQRAVYSVEAKVAGIQLRVTSIGTKTLSVFRRVMGGKPERVTIGRYPDLTPEQIERKALKIVSELAEGKSQVETKRRAKTEAKSLGAFLEDYVTTRGDKLKASTVADMRRSFREFCPDWTDTPLTKITAAMIERRHREHAERSRARANLAARYLRAIFNFAAVRHVDPDGNPLIPSNPVKRLSQLKLWHRVERRQTVIKNHDLAAWWSAVEGLTNKTIRDYLQTLVLTGLRLTEGLELKWAQVDLVGKTITILAPKNRRDHTLPLTDFLLELMARRKATAESEYVFALESGRPPAHIRHWQQLVVEESGVTFTPHDLRRTFATIAESLDIPAYALKQLMNHAIGADVTAGYIVVSVERLRDPMQKITDFVLKVAGAKRTAEVVELTWGRKKET